jgi:predicted DNA-binding ribbon-helix-helix protein
MASRSKRKEFRTSVILTEAQFKQVREIAQANDVSIAWVLRRAVDDYLEKQGPPSPELFERRKVGEGQ